MKNHLLFFLLFIVFAIISACQKDYEIEPECTEGTNPNIWHKCVLAEIDIRGSKQFDINDNGTIDLVILFEKIIKNDTLVQTVGYLNTVDVVSRENIFDYYVQEVKNSLGYPIMPKGVNQGFVVDSSLNLWANKLNIPTTYIPFFIYKRQPKEEKGLINIGDFFIAFRFYDKSEQPFAWKNGWIKLNATQEKLIIKEIAYYNVNETTIKVGEK